MKPGRELDALIAERVMGWKICRNKNGGYSIFVGDEDNYTAWSSTKDIELPDVFPKYSTDISAAWEVVEKIKYKWDNNFSIHWNGEEWVIPQPKFPDLAISVGDTAPHAICLAALEATK